MAKSQNTDVGKNPAAVSLGRRGGLARAKKLSRKARRDQARHAGLARWEQRGAEK